MPSFSEFNSRAEEFFDTWKPRVEKTTAFVIGAKALLEAADELRNSEAFKSLRQWCKDRVYQIMDRLKSELKKFLEGFHELMGDMHKQYMSTFMPSFLR